jgi:hypothetical protein
MMLIVILAGARAVDSQADYGRGFSRGPRLRILDSPYDSSGSVLQLLRPSRGRQFCGFAVYQALTSPRSSLVYSKNDAYRWESGLRWIHFFSIVNKCEKESTSGTLT